MAVAVVTDSTAYLPADLPGRSRLHVVPLVVTIGGRQLREGVEVAPTDVARALGERRVAVTTSRPAPSAFAEAYRSLLDAGAGGVVSVHLSARLSGTYESAVLAAQEFGGRVAVVDAASAGMAVGFVAVAADEAAAAGGDVATVRDAAVAAAGRTSTLFYVDTLEFLRRGGRIGAASALLGTALSVKPILHVVAGEVLLKEKVRTTGRALARLADLAAEAADGAIVDLGVQHLANSERAEALRRSLTERLAGQVRAGYLSEIGAAVAAHTGPGVIGVAVYRLP